MARYIKAVECADIISERFNIPLSDLVDVFAEIPTADVVPKSEVAREIFEEIYKTMNSVYASVQHSCVGMHGDNPETMRLIGKLEGVKYLGDEIAELKKKYQIESTEL